MFGSTKSHHIGVLGLGIIGSRIAECLRQAGRQVYVWNRTPKPQPNFLASPAEVAEVAATLQIFVSDNKALLEIMEALLPALTPSHLILCHSTVSPLTIKKAAAIAESKGAVFVDAPFTGSKAAAEKADLVYYLGASKEHVERAKKVLEHSSKKILHLGEVGDASLLKLCTNTISAAIVGALAESLAIVKSHGIAPEHLLEALVPNANCSNLITMKLPSMIQGNFEASFSVKNMLKDVHYAQELAKEKKLHVPILQSSLQQLQLASNAHDAEEDYSAVLKTTTNSSSQKL